MRPRSRTEEHVGEWKLTLWADTLEELFVEGARRISREFGPTDDAPGEWERISLTAGDAASLLVEWFNELVGRGEIARRAFDEVRALKLADGRLEAEVRGRPVREWRSPLKAATYHGLRLERTGGRWKAVVLFDV